MLVPDPPDGTTNFIHSNPQICTILGYMVDKVLTGGQQSRNIYQEVQFAIVHNPILDQTWTAQKGQVSRLHRVKDVLLSISLTRELSVTARGSMSPAVRRWTSAS